MKRFKNWLYRRKLAKRWGMKPSEIVIIETSKMTPEDLMGVPMNFGRPHKNV